MTKGRLSGRITLCALCLALLGVLAGCGGSPQTPAQAAETFMQALKTNNTAQIESVYNGDVSVQDIVGTTDIAGEESNYLFEEGQGEDFITQKLIDFDYTIGNETVDGDTATVDVTIKTYNLGGAFTSFFTDYMQQALVMAFAGGTQEQLEELGLQIFKDKVNTMSKDYEATIPLHLNKVNGQWKVEDINDQESFVNAITGGTLTALEELATSLDESASALQ